MATQKAAAPTLSKKRRPNILYVMFDQLAPQFLPSYGHKVVKAPNLSRLAAEGVQFDSAYTNSPLCAPGRFSMMAGQLCSRIGAWDNAAEFPSSSDLRALPTGRGLSDVPFRQDAFRRTGPAARLRGSRHHRHVSWRFRLDPDLGGAEKIHWWFHNMLSVTEAGPYDRSLEMEHDDEVAYTTQRWLHDHARGNDPRPFMMCVSFMQPHDPYLGPRPDYNSYREDEIDLPVAPYVAPAKREPVAKRMYDLYDRDEYRVTERHIRAARRGYYAMISYSDRLLGQVLRTLEETGQTDNTIIVVSADHGDMLGERGLWYKMTFFEHSTRVPMIIHAPKALKARQVAEHVSLMDLLPTFCDIATDGKGISYAAPVDGNSLLGLAAGSKKGWSNTVFGEYMAEGTFQPAFMIRRDGRVR